MTSKLFFNAVFELVDQWCSSVDVRDYLGLLFAILGEVRDAAEHSFFDVSDDYRGGNDSDSDDSRSPRGGNRQGLALADDSELLVGDGSETGPSQLEGRRRRHRDPGLTSASVMSDLSKSLDLGGNGDSDDPAAAARRRRQGLHGAELGDGSKTGDSAAEGHDSAWLPASGQDARGHFDNDPSRPWIGAWRNPELARRIPYMRYGRVLQCFALALARCRYRRLGLPCRT